MLIILERSSITGRSSSAAPEAIKNSSPVKRPYIETDDSDWVLWYPKKLLILALCTGCRQNTFSRNNMVGKLFFLIICIL